MRVVDGEGGSLFVPLAEQDAYPLNGTLVTRRPNITMRVLHRRVIDGMIAAVDKRMQEKSPLVNGMQSCEMSYLLHRANLSNQNLPHEKCVNRNKFDN